MLGRSRKLTKGLGDAFGPGIVSEAVLGRTAYGGGAGGERIATPACCPIVIHVLAAATPPGSSGRSGQSLRFVP